MLQSSIRAKYTVEHNGANAALIHVTADFGAALQDTTANTYQDDPVLFISDVLARAFNMAHFVDTG
jgi:hypothetical protein